MAKRGRKSRQALRLADYEVDLAFADALREATEHPPTPTAEQRELMGRHFKAESVVKADQGVISRLTRQLASAPEAAKEDLQDQIDVAKAQLELDQGPHQLVLRTRRSGSSG